VGAWGFVFGATISGADARYLNDSARKICFSAKDMRSQIMAAEFLRDGNLTHQTLNGEWR
jgi:hypothetical protein